MDFGFTANRIKPLRRLRLTITDKLMVSVSLKLYKIIEIVPSGHEYATACIDEICVPEIRTVIRREPTGMNLAK